MSGQNSKVATATKVKLGNKLAFACADIFGGGSFNIINFLFTPFDFGGGYSHDLPHPHFAFHQNAGRHHRPFHRADYRRKKPGKFGKRRYFMLICAPLVLIGLVLLFSRGITVTQSVALKCVFVVLVYMLYATAQSFVLIPTTPTQAK